MGDRGGCYSSQYTKTWDPIFSEDRKPKKEVESYVEYKRTAHNAFGDDLDMFLQDSEDSEPSWQVEKVKQFCQGACLDGLKLGRGVSGTRRGAWLDDTSCAEEDGLGRRREYNNLLSATGLYRLLKEPRFGKQGTPNADRRLICIDKLDPFYVLALAETASFHQVPVLRDAIWKHIDLKTSIKVKILPKQYKVFQLELHIPSFVLKTCPLQNDGSLSASNCPSLSWIDLSFLNIQATSKGQRLFAAQKTQFSFVICGSDDSHWVAYAFGDMGSDEEDLEDCGAFREDMIAAPGNLNANIPIWDPREYFLTILGIKMAKLLKRWEYLVQMVECNIKKYHNRNSSALAHDAQATEEGCDNAKRTFYWTQNAKVLLNNLLGALSETIKAWERFSARNGGAGYFFEADSRPGSPETRFPELIAPITEIFEALESLREILVVLDRDCHELAQTLQLRLTLEFNEAAQHNGLSTELTMTIISPFALAAAYFSMPQDVIPFKKNSSSFGISILVIMTVVRLLFAILGSLPRRPWWWKKIIAWIKVVQLEEMAKFIRESEHRNIFMLRRDRNSHGRAASDVEMGRVGA